MQALQTCESLSNGGDQRTSHSHCYQTANECNSCFEVSGMASPITYLLLLCCLLVQQAYAQPLPDEAKKAFAYLNQVRANPGKYSQEIGANLNRLKPRPTLTWNDTLARVAEQKALDMGKRKYF